MLDDVTVDRLGRVRPHAADQQGRRPRPLAAGQLRPPGRRRHADRPGDRRHQPPGRIRQGRPGRTSRRSSPRSTTTWASIRPRRSSTRPAGRSTWSTTASRSGSWCSQTCRLFDRPADNRLQVVSLSLSASSRCQNSSWSASCSFAPWRCCCAAHRATNGTIPHAAGSCAWRRWDWSWPSPAPPSGTPTRTMPMRRRPT